MFPHPNVNNYDYLEQDEKSQHQDPDIFQHPCISMPVDIDERIRVKSGAGSPQKHDKQVDQWVDHPLKRSLPGKGALRHQQKPMENVQKGDHIVQQEVRYPL